MIYTSAIYATADESMVTGTDAEGNSENRKVSEPHEFRREKEFITGYLAAGNTIAPYVAPPVPTPTLTKRQIVAAMILGAAILDPDADVAAGIGTITDPTIRALALNDWRNAPYYVRSHALFNDADMLTALGMTPTAIDGLWTLAATLPA